MSEYTKSCPHAVPQASSQLHGICVFCYRDRLGSAGQRIEELEEWIRMHHEVCRYGDTDEIWIACDVSEPDDLYSILEGGQR